MNTKFKTFLSQHLDIDNIQIAESTIFNEISTNQTFQQIVQIYIDTTKKLNIKQQYKNILIEYMKWYASLSKQYTYDTINKNPSRIFAYVSIYNENVCTYAYIDIDYCSIILQNTDIYTFDKISKDNIHYSIRPLNKLRPVDWQHPIILIQHMEYPEFKVIDGNHRYQNALRQNQSLPMQILPYSEITPKCFINNFNYLLFIIKNEFNRIYSLCASNYNLKIVNAQINNYKLHVLKLLETQ
ncbi:hypothetical protein [Holdemanella biformis]